MGHNLICMKTSQFHDLKKLPLKSCCSMGRLPPENKKKKKKISFRNIISRKIDTKITTPGLFLSGRLRPGKFPP